MVECCAAKGYEATTNADVCAAAGVSPEAFEGAFADKAECLGAAMETVVEEGWRALDEVRAQDMSWAAVLRDGVAVLLRLMAERPAFAHVALVEAPTAGGRAGALHGSARASLLEFLEQGREQAELGIPESAARGALAGAEALAVSQVVAGKAGQLRALAPEVLYMLAVPFLGVGEARRLATEGARRHLRAVA